MKLDLFELARKSGLPISWWEKARQEGETREWRELNLFAELIMEDNDRLLKMSLEALRYMKLDYLRKDGLGFDLIASSKMFDTLKKLEEHFGVEE